jgi:O-antigen ligase
MKNRISSSSIFEYLKTAFFIILFAWISFFPQPLQERYGIYVRVYLGVFLLILLMSKKYLRLSFSGRDWPLWLFLISMLSGMIFATDRNTAWAAYIYLSATFFTLFYIGKSLYHYEKDRFTLSLIICISGCLVAFIGLMELYFGKNIIYENLIFNPFYKRYIKLYPRPMSTQFNPAVLGSYLIGCLPFSLYFLKNRSLILRTLGIFASSSCILVILSTSSRGVFLGFISMLLFYFWMNKRKKIVYLFLLLSVIFILTCSPNKDSGLNRFSLTRMIAGSYDSAVSGYRLDRINMTIKILRDYPFFGIGLNHFRIRFKDYKDYYDEKGAKEFYEFMIPDNMYLALLSEIGFIGALGFFIFLLYLFKNGLMQIGRIQDMDQRQMIIIPMSALVGLLVNMGAYDLFYWNNPFSLFCLICGFIQSGINKNLT